MTPQPQKPEAGRRKRTSGVVVPNQPTRLQRFGAWLFFILLRALALTIRFDWKGSAKILENPPAGPMIFCIWHNRLGLCMEAYRKLKKSSPRRGLAALVSASKDGAFLAGILEQFGVEPVRGSTSRRGPQALLELTSAAERGLDLAITPDGPRGPCYKVQEGVMAMAQLTGLPVVPFSFRARWKISLKSWDRFQIPLPFTYCEMNAGEPIHIPRDISDAERELLRQKVEQALNRLAQD
ncbi:MAG: lysophospholipid acyltransferase family protein [Verrucomicrobiota bacterium]